MGIGDKYSILIQSCGTVVVGIMLALITNWKICLILMSYFPIVLCIIRLTQKKIVASQQITTRVGGKLKSQTEETLMNLKLVQSFTNEKLELDKFKKLNKDLKESNIKNN
jgi:ABC-type multidrug transport system fused ATPase/permease subunit